MQTCFRFDLNNPESRQIVSICLIDLRSRWKKGFQQQNIFPFFANMAFFRIKALGRFQRQYHFLLLLEVWK